VKRRTTRRGFLAAAASAAAVLPRAAEARLAPKDVRSFGARGTGHHDDTAAFQAALREGGHVFVPAGRYRLSKTLRVPPGTSLAGATMGDTILLHDAGSDPLLSFRGGGGCSIETIRIYGGSGPAVQLGSPRVAAGAGITIKDVVVDSLRNVAFAAYGATGISFLAGSTRNCRAAIRLERGAGQPCDDFSIVAFYVFNGGGPSAIDIAQGTRNGTILGSTVESRRYSAPGMVVRGSGHSILSTHFEDNDGTQLLVSASNCVLRGNRFFGGRRVKQDLASSGDENFFECNFLQNGKSISTGKSCVSRDTAVLSPGSWVLTGAGSKSIGDSLNGSPFSAVRA